MKNDKYIFLCVILSILTMWVLISNASEINEFRQIEQKKNYVTIFEECKNKKNNSYAVFTLGDYLYHGRKGITIDTVQGRKYYEQAVPLLLPLAHKGDNVAQYYLGRCYEYGSKDNSTARKWYIKAADNGNSDAMVKAAMFIAKRKGGGDRDFARVMEYIHKAIAAGNQDGKALWASTFIEERKDIETGIQLAREAAEAGSPLGQMLLGAIYLQGMGSVQKNEIKAMELFQASSDQGISLVNNELARLKQKHSKDNNKPR